METAEKDIPTHAHWKVYEEAKAELRKQDLDPKEYELEIQRIAEKLGI